jgi:hypothetical protein
MSANGTQRHSNYDCAFCHDRPMLNAAAWVSAEQPKHLTCPRCGRKPEDYTPPADVADGPEEANER